MKKKRDPHCNNLQMYRKLTEKDLYDDFQADLWVLHTLREFIIEVNSAAEKPIGLMGYRIKTSRLSAVTHGVGF